MIRLIAVLAILASALSACADTRARPVVALPNGYYLQPDQDAQTELVKRDGHRVLPGPVAAYSVAGEIVTGASGKSVHESHSYANDLPFHGGTDTRYFILDTRSGQLESNLEADAWRSKLAELGAPRAPELYAPLPWQ